MIHICYPLANRPNLLCFSDLLWVANFCRKVANSLSRRPCDKSDVPGAVEEWIVHVADSARSKPQCTTTAAISGYDAKHSRWKMRWETRIRVAQAAIAGPK
jgi:hypothetical protein